MHDHDGGTCGCRSAAAGRAEAGLIGRILADAGLGALEQSGAVLDSASLGGVIRLAPVGEAPEILAEGEQRLLRHGMQALTLRGGDLLEIVAPLGGIAELLVGSLVLEAGARVTLHGQVRILARTLTGSAGAPVTVTVIGRDGRAGGPGENGGTAPALPRIGLFAERISGVFTFVGQGGNGGAGGSPGGNGGKALGGGSIDIAYGAQTGLLSCSRDVSACGLGGAAGAGGIAGPDSDPIGRLALAVVPLVGPSAATPLTADYNQAFTARLPPLDGPDSRRDFDDAARGLFPASTPVPPVVGRHGVIWDVGQFSFLAGEQRPPSVNPSLWRNAQLNYINGVFTVADGIWQVRGLDVSVITFIRGESGLIVIDPLTSAETARAAHRLLRDTLGLTEAQARVSAVIYSHNHVDHYGGVLGVLHPFAETEGDEGNPDGIPIHAPSGFLNAAVSENVYAGTAMGRRAVYMYGNILPHGPLGQLSIGLGLKISAATITLVEPNDTIVDSDPDHKGSSNPQLSISNLVPRTIDGIEFMFQLTPNTEAPAEMNIAFKYPAGAATYTMLHIAENCCHTLHNTLTLRGAKVRDPLAWANFLDQAIANFGPDVEIMLAAHHWPRWGRDNILDMLGKERDAYRYLNDQVLRQANKGQTMVEIAEDLRLPSGLDQAWFLRGNYGTLNHDAKAVYQFYLGWFDGVPAHLHPLPPQQQSRKYLEFMGGPEAVIAKARTCYARGEYRWVATVMNDVVFALSPEPGQVSPIAEARRVPFLDEARALLAQTYEQLGYQAESGTWRNFYLAGAQELRNGVLPIPGAMPGSLQVMFSMPSQNFLDYVAILIKAEETEGVEIVLDFVLSDPPGDGPDPEQQRLILRNGVLRHYQTNMANPVPLPPDVLTKPDATVKTSMRTFRWLVLTGQDPSGLPQETFDIDGNAAKVVTFFELLDRFDPWFNIVTP